MDKNAIKKYAVWARRELISRVSQRAALYEITTEGYGDQNANSVHGRLMSAEEKKQRIALIAQIKEKGYEQQGHHGIRHQECGIQRQSADIHIDCKRCQGGKAYS